MKLHFSLRLELDISKKVFELDREALRIIRNATLYARDLVRGLQ